MLQLLSARKLHQLGIGVCLVVSSLSYADVVFDGSFNPNNAGLRLDGSQTNGQIFIDTEHGIISDSNLFYRFSEFDLRNGQSAIFQSINSSINPAEINNIIGRVTSELLSAPTQSFIDGLIDSSNYTNANLWLYNPAGFFLGPNFSLDIAGSFYISSSESIIFASGDALSLSRPSTMAQLDLADPVSFGFLGDVTGSIQMEGSNVTLKDGMTFAAAGSAVELEGVSLQVSGGRVNLAALDDAGEVAVVDLSSPNPSISNPFVDVELGPVTISGSNINLNNRSGMTLLGSNIDVSNSSISSDNGYVIARAIESLAANSSVRFDNFGSTVTSSLAVAGDVSLTGTQIEVIGADSGNLAIVGGRLVVDSTTLLHDKSGGASPLGALELAGNDIVITGSQLTAVNNSGFPATGAADITITSNGNITIDDGSFVAVEIGGDGVGGVTTIQSETMTLDRGSIEATVRGDGVGGVVNVNASDLTIVNDASIYAATEDNAQGGTVNVTSNSIQLDVDSSIETESFDQSTGADIVVGPTPVTSITLDNDSGIGSTSHDDSTGGDVSIEVSELTARALSGVGVESRDASGGGTVTVQAETVEFIGGGVAVHSQDSANGGQVSLTADEVKVSQGGLISNTSFIAAQGGTLRLAAETMGVDTASRVVNIANLTARGGTTELQGGSITFDSALVSMTNSLGATGGKIIIGGESTAINNGTSVFAENSGRAQRGLLQISSNDIDINDSTVFVSASGNSVGADLILGTPQTQLLRQVAITNAQGTLDASNSDIYSMATEQAAGGSVFIENANTTLRNSDLHGHAFNGSRAGRVSVLSAESINVLDNSTITVETIDNGVSAELRLEAPTIVVDNSVATVRSDHQARGGRFDIVADRFELKNGARVEVLSTGDSSGGRVNVNTTTETLLDNSQMAVVASGNSQGGTVEITTAQLTAGGISNFDNIALETATGGQLTFNVLEDANLSDSVATVTAFDSAQGGDLFLSSQTLALDNGALRVITQGGATGGSLTTEQSQSFSLNGGSLVNDAVGSSRGGTLSVTAPQFSLSPNGGMAVHHKTENQAQGGLTSLNGGSLNLDNVSVLAEALGNSQGGQLHINATSVGMKNAARIETTADAGATGANLLLTAGQVVVESASTIASHANGASVGGAITLDVGSLSLDNGSITSRLGEQSTSATGGAIVATATDSITLRNLSAIETSGNTGNGAIGPISMAANTMVISEGSQVISAIGDGVSGAEVTLNATESLTIAGRGTVGSNSVASGVTATNTNNSTQNAGTVALRGGVITLADFGEVSSQNAGSGKGADIAVSGVSITLDSNSAISSLTTGTGAGGDVSLATGPNTLQTARLVAMTNASDIKLENNAQVSVASASAGQAGRLDISALNDLIVQSARILASSGGQGNGSPVSLNAANIVLDDGTVESFASFANGANLRISAAQSITLRGDSQIKAEHEGLGEPGAIAGEIRLNAQLISFEDAAKILSTVAGTAAGGNIFLLSENGLQMLGQQSEVRSLTEGSGKGANIELNDQTSVQVSDASRIISETSGAGVGGDICVLAPSVTIQQDSSVQALSGGLGTTGTIGLGQCGTEQVATKVVIVDSRIISDGGNIDIFASGELDIQRSQIIADNGSESVLDFTTLSDVNTAPNAENSRLGIETNDLLVVDSDLRGRNLDLRYNSLNPSSNRFVTSGFEPTNNSSSVLELEDQDKDTLRKAEEDIKSATEQSFLEKMLVSKGSCIPKSSDKSSFALGMQAQVSPSPDSYRGSTFSYIHDGRTTADTGASLAEVGYLADLRPCNDMISQHEVIWQ